LYFVQIANKLGLYKKRFLQNNYEEEFITFNGIDIIKNFFLFSHWKKHEIAYYSASYGVLVHGKPNSCTRFEFLKAGIMKSSSLGDLTPHYLVKLTDVT
jgi:hypothetical protein